MTLERIPITSQLTFDSYVADWAALALRLINELAAAQAGGKANPPLTSPSRQLSAISATMRDTGRHDLAKLKVDDAVLVTKAVWQLRDAVDRSIDDDLRGAAVILNEVLLASHAIPSLQEHPGGPIVFAFHTRGQGPGESCVADMAASVALIIGSGRAARLGRCEAANCDRVFYDTTRNASRRFCELACQNRAKAVAYRARQAN